MKTSVVNIRKEEYDQYCGRAGKGQDGYFGNPFSSHSREENISRFRVYFYQRLDKDKEFEKRVLELKGKRLGCFCAPLPCHCDVIAEYLNSGTNKSIKDGNLEQFKHQTDPKSGRYLCNANAPMPINRPKGSRWTHPDAKYIDDDYGRGGGVADGDYEKYECPNCKHVFYVELPN